MAFQDQRATGTWTTPEWAQYYDLQSGDLRPPRLDLAILWLLMSRPCFVGISYALRRAVCENDEWSVTLLDLPENRDLSDSPDPSYKGEALVFVTKYFSGWGLKMKDF